jgi:hypothetical protein
MRDFSLGGVLKAALIAGVVAGLAAAAFAFLATEPMIERAIDLETLRTIPPHRAPARVFPPIRSSASS